MGTTIPIREKEELKKFISYYKEVHPNPRNYALTVLGLHTALRISDILLLRWENVYDYEKNQFRTHLWLKEKKTGKEAIIALNPQAIDALQIYQSTRLTNPKDYIFTKNTDYNKPLDRTHVYRIICKAAQEALHMEHVSCHSLRKTFGYHAWKQGTPPALLMAIYNHSSYQVTKRYLGIEQDEKDAIFLEIDI